MKNTCILIGEDNLLIESGNLLLARGVVIKAVISTIENIKHWCRQRKIACFASIESYYGSTPEPVDYLFSIVNSILLKEEHLKGIKRASFNYHDSLLPAYAGLNATVWALLNNEKKHGITWHLINASIDSGEIVYQKEFSSEGETALSLNLRCFEEALIGLNSIVDALESDNLESLPQSTYHRSYFSKGQVLPNLGFINWACPAHVIYQQYRALAHGHYDNKVGSFKVWMGASWLIISDMDLTSIDYSYKRAGELIAIRETGIEIATLSTSIVIKECLLPMGRRLSPLEWAEEYSLKEGFEFGSPNEQWISELSTFYSRALIRESIWIEQFKKMSDHLIFSERAYDKDAIMVPSGTVSLKHCHEFIKTYGFLECAIAFIFIYLYRLNDYESCSCFLLDSIKDFPSSRLFMTLFGNKRPLVSQFSAEARFSDVFDLMSKQVRDIINETPYLTDLIARHPSLEEISLEPMVTIGRSTSLPTNSILHFELNEEQGEMTIYQKINLHYQEGELKPLIHYLPDHLHNIMQKAVVAPKARINSFDFLADTEREQLYAWGQGKLSPLPLESIYTLFEKKAAVRPEAIAVYEGATQITYSALLEKAEHIASYIKSLSIPPKTPIGIYMDRSKEMLFTVLGILGAGCIYVPLDRKYPLNKIYYIIENAEIKYVFTHDLNLVPFILEDGSVSITICSLAQILASTSQEVVQKSNLTPLASNEVAYIMYTSGTTGMPKGVVISHQNVINYCTWFTQTTSFNEHSIIDFSSSLAFDLSIPCTLAPLMFGGAVSVCSEEEKLNPELYLMYLKKFQITHIELTPGYLELLLHFPERIKKIDRLQYLLLGADTVHTEEVNQWMALCPSSRVVNEYGPTETTVSVTSYFVQPSVPLTSAVVPIGSPALNSTSYLFDKHMNLCPIGMKGELCIGGKQVALGYLKNPKLTKKKFIPVSFNGDDRLYKTGDLACWLPMGALQFFGRNDHQVKIHGYRVELPAVEAVLMKHEHITQAVVVIKKQNNHPYLRAYLVVDDSNITRKAINQFLAQYLPTYMYPKELCLVDFIPLKENEKINFDLLEHQSNRLLTYEYTQDEQLSDMEQLCLTCWQESFHRKASQLDEDFFALGGDSLIALHIMMHLKNKLQQEIHLAMLFKYPTIRALASYLEKDGKSAVNYNHQKNSCLIELSSGPHKTPLFLVHPVGGTLFWYQQLAHELKEEFTIIGIEDPCINNKAFCFTSFADMANYYVEAILEYYPDGPIYLGGASYGANLAVEMAHQLHAQGKELEFLGLFDGWARYPSALMQHTTVEQVLHYHEALISEDTDYLHTLEEHRKKLLQEHSLVLINANAHLFKARELWSQFAACNLEDNGWRAYIRGDFQIHLVPGNHETLFFAPNVGSVAQLIKRIILGEPEKGCQ